MELKPDEKNYSIKAPIFFNYKEKQSLKDYSISSDLKQMKEGPINGLILKFCWALQDFVMKWYLAALTSIYDQSKYKLHCKTPDHTNPSS